MKSEKTADKANSFLKFEEDEIDNNLNIQKELERNKNKSTKSIKKKEIENQSYNILLKSLPTKNDIIQIDKNYENTPRKVYIRTEKDFSSSKQKNLKEINKKNEINNNNEKTEGLKMIKLFEIKKEENKYKDENKENNPFLKNISKNRYFNIYAQEAEGDFSLTQIEKDCSGIYDSSISNENQINPDYFFKDSPKNIFKNDKSNEQSVNSNDNKP